MVATSTYIDDYIGNTKIVVLGIIIGFLFVFLFLISPPDKTVNDDSATSSEILDWAVLNNVERKDDQPLDTRVVANIYTFNILSNEVKILCWAMTTPGNHKSRAVHVLKTWGRRCNKLSFMSTVADDEINAIPVSDEGGSWNKLKEASKYVYTNHLDEYDWFLKADDDNYVTVENLRLMLYQYAPTAPIYFGCKYKPTKEQDFISTDAGFVLSREALRRFVEDAIPDEKNCRQYDHGIEDVQIGTCLENVHVIAGDALDALGKQRFLPFNPEYHFKPKQVIPDNFHLDGYLEYLYFKAAEEMKGSSDSAVLFHHITPNQMYVLDFFIYRLRRFGIVRYPQPLPSKLSVTL